VSSPIFRVWVPGDPKPKGSGTPFKNEHTGKLGVKSACEGLGAWEDKLIILARSQLARDGLRATKAAPLFPSGPVRVSLWFYLTRPQDHFVNRDGKRLKPSAPTWHDVYPDGDKLERAVGDAMTKAFVWRDDGQAAAVAKEKRWADPKTGPGVWVQVEALEEREVA